jgi:hypothetical protein
MTATGSRRSPAQDVPTAAELTAMTDQELVDRHDAQVARSRETGEPVSDVYLGELGRRMAELRDEKMLRFAVAALVVSGAVLFITLFTLALAL